MKKFLVSISIASLGILITCASMGVLIAGGTTTSEAKLPSGFRPVTEDVLAEDSEVMVIQHLKTGCYYTLVDSFEGNGFVQMFVEKNGVSVPYCDK